MSTIRKILSKLKTIPKRRYIPVLIVIVLAAVIALPTLSRYKNRIDIQAILSDENNWDGTVATSYRNGSGKINDPYIISNAKELAYFEKMLETTDYENTYFELANDIIINNGTFEYNENDKITYTLKSKKLYIKEYTTELYNNSNRKGNKISDINKLNTLDNFRGYFNGNYYSIYGLYITSEEETELALFNNLKGTVENLYLENTLIYGGSTTAALATTASNSTIKDIFIDGEIVGTKDQRKETKQITLEDISISKEASEISEILVLPIDENIDPVKISLTGSYSTTSNKNILINDQEIEPGDFEISIDTTEKESLDIIAKDELASEITLTNLVYEVTYYTDTYAISAGVVGNINSSTLTNIINKSNIYGTNDSAGLVGNMSNTDIINAYNTGNIKATFTASGLIGTIESSLSETLISKTYNSGELDSISTTSFINKISNNDNVVFENTFNTAEAYYGIGTIENTSVEVNNVLDINVLDVQEGETIGEIIEDSTNQINDPEFLKETLGFNEYVDGTDLENNSTNAWVYEDGYLPILYFDDLNNPIATLYVGNYSWNDLGYDLRNIYITNEIAFRIVPTDELNNYKNAYYYIHKEENELKTRENVKSITEWEEYTDIVKLTEEGYYTIYAKIIDKNDTTTYINSERLVIDLKEPEVTLSMNDNSWNELTNEINSIHILEKSNLTVNATGGLADVASIKYHLANKMLTEEELKALEDTNWLEYNEKIEITECGNYIVYLKVTDEAERIKYINSDNIIYGGYTEKLTIGRNKISEETEINISSKSSVTYNFKYNEERNYQEGDNSNLVTNILLPENTIMTLIDNTTNEVYKYKITSKDDNYGYETSCKTDDETCQKYATYPLKNFIKLGQTDTSQIFNDSEFISNTSKDLTLTIDFAKANIEETFTLETYLELNNNQNDFIISTLKETIVPVNVHPSKDLEINLTTQNEPGIINYNSDSETEVVLNASINLKNEGSKTIYDTTKENNKLGIAIKLVDMEDNIIEKQHLNNIKFQIGEKYYSPDNDGITRINISDSNETTTETLKIISYLSNTKLDIGEYKFVIIPFSAADGKYSSDLDRTTVEIPVVVSNKKELNYGFNTKITEITETNEEQEFTSIISKTTKEDDEVKENKNTKLKINVIESSTLKESNIRISLYKRATKFAVDQTYELVDLQEFITNKLIKVEENVYNIENNELILEFENEKFENFGYELRIELYDSNRKISTIKKKFIVK